MPVSEATMTLLTGRTRSDVIVGAIRKAEVGLRGRQRLAHEPSRRGQAVHAPPRGGALRCLSAFTLIELLLVMTLLAIVISVAMPTLSHFFRGRTLDSEARRLLALTHHGKSRAVSEGIPMVLWVDADQGSYGLEEEPGWDETDPRAVEFKLGKDLEMEVVRTNVVKKQIIQSQFPANSTTASDTTHRDLPEIKFFPDGSIDITSLTAVQLSEKEGGKLWLAQSANRLDYEIRSEFNQ